MNIVILTGAGASVASGLKTFRGPAQLYNAEDVARLSHTSALKSNPDAVWKFWGAIRAEALAAQPNAAHRAIAELENRLGPDDRLTVITMNVDGLHQRAGSTKVIEIHGSLLHSRCRSSKHHLRFADCGTHQNGAPVCSCGELVRPDVLLFGESLNDSLWRKAHRAAHQASVFISVGTSNTVYPAANLVKNPFYRRAQTIFINPEIPEGLRYFRKRIANTAENALPRILAELVP